MTNEEIRRELDTLVDKKYQEFHSGLCPGVDNILGVRVPTLRNFAKEIAKQENVEAYLETAANNSYEEIMLQGMVLGQTKQLTLESFFYYLKQFIPKINNWAICDITASGLKITKKYPQEMWQFLLPYLSSKQEFEVRFAIVMFLDFYIIPAYIEPVLVILNKIKHEGYYVKMAVAWAISIAYIRFPEQTMVLLQDNQLDDFTFNKALQKIIESYRVSDEEKQQMRKMKRKM
ncbi:MAG: DNA alkylation repair protein [Clostridia bacterium]